MLPEYMKLAKRSSDERVDLINKWSHWFYDNTETFEGKLGMQLAYLWAAISRGTKIEVDPSSPIVRLLEQKQVGKSELIWEYIDSIPETAEEKPHHLYRVGIREVHVSQRLVWARDEEEALGIAGDQGEEEIVEYSHTMSKDTWTVELQEGADGPVAAPPQPAA